jgi:hypothetical protein
VTNLGDIAHYRFLSNLASTSVDRITFVQEMDTIRCAMDVVYSLQRSELGSPMPLFSKMADSQNVCRSSQHHETKISVSDSDEQTRDFSSGSSDNYIPSKLDVSDSSDDIPAVRDCCIGLYGCYTFN